jgi:integrase
VNESTDGVGNVYEWTYRLLGIPVRGVTVPITVVSRRLGHAVASITLDVYGHCLPADDEAAAASVAAAILDGPR